MSSKKKSLDSHGGSTLETPTEGGSNSWVGRVFHVSVVQLTSLRLNSLSLPRQKNKIPGEQELNQLIFSAKACFWHVSLYYVTQQWCSEIQIGFYSVFPAGDLQMRGIQWRLCEEHIAFETKILWSRCCCSRDASSYPAKGSFPSLFLSLLWEQRVLFCEAYRGMQHFCSLYSSGILILSLLKLLEWESVLL